MIKKMCPVCDLPVNAGNYCPRCRRVIRKPYTQNVDYYLNERHPVHEAECDFHNPYLEADHHGERGGSGKRYSGQKYSRRNGSGQAGAESVIRRRNLSWKPDAGNGGPDRTAGTDGPDKAARTGATAKRRTEWILQEPGRYRKCEAGGHEESHG